MLESKNQFKYRFIELGSISGIVFILILFMAILLSMALNPWFSPWTHAFSTLGGHRASYRWLFNMGLFASGLVGFPFSISLTLTAKGKVGRASVIPILLGSLSLTVLGLQPIEKTYHTPIATVLYLSSSIGIPLYALGIYREDRVKARLILAIAVLSQLMVWIPKWPSAGMPELIVFTSTSACILILSLYLRELCKPRESV